MNSAVPTGAPFGATFSYVQRLVDTGIEPLPFLKIAIVGSRGYPYVYSGYETFVKEISERLIKRGIEVHVYCHKNLFKNRPQNVNGVKLHYISTIEKKSVSQLVHSFLSLTHATFSSYDAILVVNAANGPLGWLPKLRGKRTLINVDGLEWLRPKWKGLGSKYFYFAARAATKLYDVIITDADEMQKVYLNEFKTESTVIAYGAPHYKKADLSLLEKYNLIRGSYYLIVGRLIPDNNANLIITGFLQADSNKKLVVVGDVPYKDEYAEGLKKLQNDKVIFLGYITDSSELTALYQNCFAYIHGHKYGGTNPTMLSAMANKCAILALNTRFNREMLADSLGIFFEEDERSVALQIKNLENEPHTRENLRKKVTQGLTAKYNWDNVTDAYVARIRNLLLNRLVQDFWWNKFIKRSFDILFSVCFFVFVGWWLMSLIAILIKLTSRGPVFFNQERWGLNGKPFICHKFRTMINHSPSVDADGNYLQACRHDGRVTRLGKYLRKTNFDELPQFWNVLVGNMSVVGPRPHPTPLNLASMDTVHGYMLRHLVKPGITGWAQVSGCRGETKEPGSMQRRVNFDLYYIYRWSFWFDCRIFFLTIINFLRGDEYAY